MKAFIPPSKAVEGELACKSSWNRLLAFLKSFFVLIIIIIICKIKIGNSQKYLVKIYSCYSKGWYTNLRFMLQHNFLYKCSLSPPQKKGGGGEEKESIH